jgi:hypothetical protein
VVSNVVFKRCRLYVETFSGKAVDYPVIGQKINEFLKFKSESPIGQFGSSDKPFSGNGNFTKAIPDLRHAHLTGDIMIVYTIRGKNPTEFRLYGVFSHDELGIGQPSNPKKQKSAAKRIGNQDF